MRWLATALLPLLFACSPPRPQYISANDTTFILNDQRDADAIGAAYRERVRLGLGSPFRVIENAASLACFHFSFLASSKNSWSFGFEPGQPPSM